MTQYVHENGGPVKETAKAISAYISYRDMGPSRSLPKLIEQFREQASRARQTPGTSPMPPTLSLETVQGWSAAYGWQARILTWQSEQDYARRQEMLRQTQKQAADNATLLQNVGAGALAICSLFLNSYIDDKTGGLKAGVEMAPRDLPRIMQAGAELVQLATGAPTTILQMGDSTSLEQVLREADEDTRATVLRGMRAALEWREKSGKG